MALCDFPDITTPRVVNPWKVHSLRIGCLTDTLYFVVDFNGNVAVHGDVAFSQ